MISPGSRAALARVLASARAVVVCDTSADTLLGSQPSIVGGADPRLVCLPLRVGEQLTGLIYLDSNLPGKVFTGLDVEILEAFASHAAPSSASRPCARNSRTSRSCCRGNCRAQPAPGPLLARCGACCRASPRAPDRPPNCRER